MPQFSQNADVVELVYTHGLGPCATSMWVRVPPSAQKFRKRIALQAGAPALGAGPALVGWRFKSSPQHRSGIHTKTAPISRVVLCSIHSSDARRTLLAQSTSDEERIDEIQPDSRREFGISRIPRQIPGNARLNHQIPATRNGTMKRNFLFLRLYFISFSLPTFKPLNLNTGLRKKAYAKHLLSSIVKSRKPYI